MKRFIFYLPLLVALACSKESTPIAAEPPKAPVSEVEKDIYENMVLSISKSDFILGDTLELTLSNPNKINLDEFDITIQDTLVSDGLKFNGSFRKVRITKKGKLKISVLSKDRRFNKSVDIAVTSKLDDGVLRVLAIGNSFSGDAVETFLGTMARFDGQKLEIGHLMVGGGNLKRLYESVTNNLNDYSYVHIDVDGKKTIYEKHNCQSVMRDNTWDIVVVQQVSDLSGVYDSYTPHLQTIIDKIKLNSAYDTKLGLHQTWAYAANSNHIGFKNYGNDQVQMYESIVKTTLRIFNEYRFDVMMPTGPAIQNARNTSIGDNLNRDGYHLDLNLGRYIAASVWYSQLFGVDMRKSTYVPPKVSKEHIELAKESVYQAIQSNNAALRK